MTGLHRTPLTTSQKIECVAKALAGQEDCGGIAGLSRDYGVSRPTVYAAKGAASEVLREHFEEPESDPTVWVKVDSAQVRRTVVALRVMAPNALRPIEDMIPIIYPGVRLSYGKVQSIAAEAEAQAGAFNAKADLSEVCAGALDELFSQGEAVLGGVDLDSGYVFGLALRETRSGEDWAQVLTQGQAQGLNLAVVVKDAAKGIEAGVNEVFPQAEQRDDCFHALYELNKLRRRLEQRAYGAIAAEEEAHHQLPKIPLSDGKRRRCQRHKIGRAHRHCQDAIARYDAFEATLREVQEALECVDLTDGHLRSAEEVKAMVEHAAETLHRLDPLCHKVARYLRNRAAGLSLATGELNTRLHELATTYSLGAVAVACMLWRLVFELQNDRRPWQRAEQHRQLLGAFAYLKYLLGPQLDALLNAVKALLEQRHRASSAIEGFNAALRPFLYVHKGVTQGFLELFRAYHNLKTRRWGPHQGTSAHHCLSGQAVGDWLTLLGFPPSSTLH
jgi:NAD(P)-dependent dehydrogenase (short-subunit alcohol dehydrogenase family)